MWHSYESCPISFENLVIEERRRYNGYFFKNTKYLQLKDVKFVNMHVCNVVLFEWEGQYSMQLLHLQNDLLQCIRNQQGLFKTHDLVIEENVEKCLSTRCMKTHLTITSCYSHSCWLQRKLLAYIIVKWNILKWQCNQYFK